MTSRLQTSLMLLLPALVFVGLQLRALDYAFVWTDHGEIEQATIIRPPGRWLAAFGEPLHTGLDLRLAGVPQSYYRPLHVVLASAIDSGLGREPRNFRLASIALGAATASLFTLLAWLLLQRRGAALFAGAVVACHPAGIEVYTWIAGLSAALTSLFVVASVLAGLLALRAPGRAVRNGWVGVSLAALVAGLLSKENATITPALSLALVSSCLGGKYVREASPRGGAGRAAPLGRLPDGPLFRRTVAILIGAQAVVVALHLAVWRPWVLGAVAVGPGLVGGGVETHLASAISIWPASLAWLWLPLRSTTSDVVPIVANLLDPRVAMGIVLALVSLLAWWRLLRRGHGVAALGLVWIWIAYLPTSGVVPLLHARAERNLFLSVFGAALLWPLIGDALLRRWHRFPRWLPVVLAMFVVTLLAQRTWHRLPAWQSTTDLFERDVAGDPHYREGRYQLAVALHTDGRDREAKVHVDTVIAQRAERDRFSSDVFEPAVLELACRVNDRLDRPRDTVRLLEVDLAGQTSIEATPGLYFCYAATIETLGRCEESLEIYHGLAKLDPGHPAFTVSIARCHARMGRFAQSRSWLEKVSRETARDPALAVAIDQVREMLRVGESRRRGARRRRDARSR